MKDIELYVVIVDEKDNEKGLLEKMEAHRKGILHRAISAFIFNSKGDWLLQQRAIDKYHCPGKWSNACCTHPFHGESYQDAAQRRLKEEMGISPHIEQWFQFVYRAELEDGLVEHEYDTVFAGTSDEIPSINPAEVSNYKYISSELLDQEIKSHPDQFTPWFLKMYPRIKAMRDEQIHSQLPLANDH